MRIAPLLAVLLLSTSMHAQWQIQDAHTTSDLRAVDYVGDGIAWASGANGTVLRTEDAGIVWQTCTIPPGAEQLDFRGVQAFDKNTAIVMSSGKGHLSRLYKTTDGCHSWNLVFTNAEEAGTWSALAFLDSASRHHADEGILIGEQVGGAFPIFQSSNQGSSWAPRITAGKEEPKIKKASAKTDEVLFATSNGALSLWSQAFFVFVTGGLSGARIHYVDETGLCEETGLRCTLKFEHVDLPGFPHSSSSGAFAIAAKDHHSYFPLRLMIVGGDYERPEQGAAAFVSSRDGFHIPMTSYFNVNASLIQPHGYRSAVAYDEQHNAWITVGPNGTDISTDDGHSWQPLKPRQGDAPDADQHWNALSLPFAVGTHGRIGLLQPVSMSRQQIDK
jgi:hypothetical protein